ncbi:MAG TPA: zinc ribbon domain-containing protein [Thermoanaerobaculia bacterium]|nr:zinc ribbon domain-containing protein [Thermoanaerobaculia bacterium]
MSSSSQAGNGRAICAACNRAIDSAARTCPYCGANPVTGERLDTQAILQEVFRPREISTSESVLEYARQRQGVVIVVSVFLALVIFAAIHQFVSMRNSSAVSDAPAVPLSELTDVTRKADETTPVPMPELDFQYDGRPQAMRTYIMEPGATPPPAPAPAQTGQAQRPPGQQANAAPPRPAARPAAPAVPR